MSLGKKIVYFAKEALYSLRMNKVMSLGAIVAVSACLFVVSLAMVGSTLVRVIAEAQREKVEIEVFLRDAAPTEQVQALQNRIASWPEVSRVRYISKEQALKRLRKMLKESPEVLEAMSGNPLPASYEIRLENPQRKTVEKVAKQIKKQSNVREVVDDPNKDIKYGKEIIPKLFAALSLVQLAAGAFVVVLCFLALILIVNTIRIAIFSRRKEIAVMKLVGASNWFIRWPFIMEGVFEGLIGALLTIVVLYLLMTAFSGLVLARTLEWFGLLSSYPIIMTQFYWLIAGLILGGILIGAMGSGVALRRFLKV